MDDEQAAVLRKHCATKSLNLSEFVRDVLMRRLGRKDLVGAVKMGRPKDIDKSG
jgi:hypothetical protein